MKKTVHTFLNADLEEIILEDRSAKIAIGKINLTIYVSSVTTETNNIERGRTKIFPVPLEIDGCFY